MKAKTIAWALLTFVIITFSLGCHKRKGEAGTKSNPIRFYFMPLKSSDVFDKNVPIIKKYLEDNTGLSIQPIKAPDFISIIRSFENKQADIAFINTLGFLLAKDMSNAEAHLLSLYGDVYRTYRGEIITLVDGPINSPTDMADKTIVFSDPFSASGYLYALKFLKDHNIKPAGTVFAGGHKEAVRIVYDGRADAAATYHTRPTASGDERDARVEILPEYPDVVDKLRIIALTDEIPNGPVALRGDLPTNIKSKLVGALMEFARSIEGRKTLIDLYNITGFSLASDADYDGVREVIKSLGKTSEEVVPGGITYYRTKVSPLLGN